MAELLLKDEKLKALLRQYCEVGIKLEEIMFELQPLIQRYFPHRKLYHKYRTMILDVEGYPLH